MIGDILQGRYHIVDKLGFGGYSTLWLAQDSQRCQYVAVKVGVASSRPHETQILRELSAPVPVSSTAVKPSITIGQELIPVLLDEFECNLHKASYSRLFPIEVARAISAGLALAVAFIHSRGYIHGDIHLRNILAKLPSSFDGLSVEQFYEKYGKPETVLISRCDGGTLPPNIPAQAVLPLNLGKAAWDFTLADAQVLLSDFGEAFASTESRCGKECHTPLAMRPPEARFEPQKPLTYAADIWSLGVSMWEIIGMKAIFSSEFTTADEITAQQIDVLGPMPSDWWEKWEEKDQFFNPRQCPKEGRHAWPAMDEAFQEGVQKYRQKNPHMGVFDEKEAAAVLDLIRRILVFKPEQRLTIEEVLATEWMAKWALSDFKRTTRANFASKVQ
ncbi:hypothetical protein PRK78_000727 [Emydomyces testavorans]|uniref:Protein kinase domain-containing protein n=1 Tax=Emydomyces testavorans TaxID=2070801 RepID=A0AAF0DBL8_9EURO|nr:hypothetical protein PRK78_000727 [Emydomyces testavorans]